ncbi:hypothetical protein Tco_1439512 [Tanacetum coccineum]
MEYRNRFWYKSFMITYLKTTIGNSTNSPNSASTLSPKKKGGIELKNISNTKMIRGMTGSHKADECKQTNQAEQVCLSERDIYDDPSLLRFYQNDDTPPWGNIKRKEKGEDGPEWIVGTPPRSTSDNPTKGETKKEGAKGAEPSIIQEPTPRPSIFYQPSKSSNLPFPSRLKKQKKDDEDERLLSIFKQIHINLSFLEAMIHMPKGAKVLKDLLSHKEKLKKAASLVKLSEEFSAIIQRCLPQKEGDPGSFTLPCLIGPLAVNNTPADLGATGRSVYQIPHRGLRESIGKSKLVVLEMDEDELVSIILGQPFLATTRAMIDLHKGKLSLRVGSETITFNIGKSMKSKHSRDDYLYCADHTAKLVHEQWADTVNHDGKWTEEDEEDSNKALAVSFYPRAESVEPLKWNAPENRLKPSSFEPPKLELKELPEHLEYAFLQENNQLPVVILSALSTTEKAKLLKALKNHKGAIAFSIADINGID